MGLVYNGLLLCTKSDRINISSHQTYQTCVQYVSWFLPQRLCSWHLEILYLCASLNIMYIITTHTTGMCFVKRKLSEIHTSRIGTRYVNKNVYQNELTVQDKYFHSQFDSESIRFEFDKLPSAVHLWHPLYAGRHNYMMSSVPFADRGFTSGIGELNWSPGQNGRHFGRRHFLIISLNKNDRFRYKFHWNLFPVVQLTIIQHWFG